MTGDLEMARGPRGEIFVRFPGGPWQRALASARAGSTGLLGAVFGDVEAGVPIQPFARAVYATKPLSRAQAQGMLGAARKALLAARQLGAGLPGTTTRDNLAQQIESVYAATPLMVDPIPEEMARPIRDLTVRAVVEFNAVAEGHKTLAQARAQLYDDLISNAKAVAAGVGDALTLALIAAAGVGAYLIFGGN